MVTNNDIEVKHRELKYSAPQQDVLETTADRVLFHSGVGSGKSQCIGVLSADFVLNYPELTGFIGANTYKQLSRSTLLRVFEVWENQFGLKKGIDYVVGHIPPENYIKIGADLNSYEGVISFSNGAKIFLATLENFEAIDGTELGWACLDETKDTREEAVKAVIVARLRQKGLLIDSSGNIYKTIEYNPITKQLDYVLDEKLKIGAIVFDSEQECYFKGKTKLKGYNPLYIFTSPAKTKWLSDWFGLDEDAEEIIKCCLSKTDYYRKRTGRQLVVISSTYHNQENLPPGYIQGLIDDYGGDENLIDMQVFGSPFGKSGGEFITTYSRLKHVLEFEPWENEAVHLAFDFNVVPYITCTLWQMQRNPETGRFKVRCFDELCLSNPKNDSESLSEEIITWYGKLLKNGLFYYGDYSGGNETTISKNLKTNYQAIENKLRAYLSNSSKRVITNQSLEKRRRFLNKIFKGVLPIDVEIHTKCRELRADLEFCKEGPDGGKLKSEVMGKNGKKYQDRGHCLDSAEYFFTSAFERLFKD